MPRFRASHGVHAGSGDSDVGETLGRPDPEAVGDDTAPRRIRARVPPVEKELAHFRPGVGVGAKGFSRPGFSSSSAVPETSLRRAMKLLEPAESQET